MKRQLKSQIIDFSKFYNDITPDSSEEIREPIVDLYEEEAIDLMFQVFEISGIHLDDCDIRISRTYDPDYREVDLKFKFEGRVFEADIPKKDWKKTAIAAENKLRSAGCDEPDIARYNEAYRGENMMPGYDAIIEFRKDGIDII